MAPSNSPAHEMKYRFLGDSGLLVSKLALGGWMDYNPSYTVDAWYEVMKTAFEHGINLFDTAEMYGNGQSEEMFGAAIRKGQEADLWQREDLVVTTKIFNGTKGFVGGGPNDQGLSRKHLIEGTKASLKRLQLEYVDILFCHRPEPLTPVEETVRAMNHLIDQGWAFYWGTSEWSALQITEACEVADRLGLIRPIVEQPQYSILERAKVEVQFADLYTKYKLGLTTWSPLCSGILSGKYAHGVPEGTRLAHPMMRTILPDADAKVATAATLSPIAAKLGCSPAQLAIAWCLSNEHVTSVLLGAKNPAQLRETLGGLAVASQLTPEIRAEIDALAPVQPGKDTATQGLLRQRFL
jgi:voltage-dependent potassium channel beta subunit